MYIVQKEGKEKGFTYYVSSSVVLDPQFIHFINILYLVLEDAARCCGPVEMILFHGRFSFYVMSLGLVFCSSVRRRWNLLELVLHCLIITSKTSLWAWVSLQSLLTGFELDALAEL